MTKYINELMIFLEIEKRVIKGCDEVYKELGVDIWEAFCRKYVKKGGGCDTCENARFVAEYPEFTPAKQLELIKLISTNLKDHKHASLYMNKSRILKKWYLNCDIRGYCFGVSNKDFAEAVANLVLVMVRDGVLEKALVKEILNND